MCRRAYWEKERIGMILSKDDSKRIVTFKSIDIENIDSFYNIDFINKGFSISKDEIAIGYLLSQRLNVDEGCL